jgi:uncharacterized protein YndB with AHSA1/START domain
MTSSTDRIEKRVFLRSPQERVWHAISDATEFGTWFGIELDGPMAAGARTCGRIKPTAADAEVAQMQEKYRGMPLALYVERVEPMNLLSFRWHPFAIASAVDYSSEPMTLVTFTLEAVEGGTMLTIVESGFDAIPIARRADAFDANEEGWNLMAQLVEKYLLMPRT